MLRVPGMYFGNKSTETYGGLKILLLFGDDGLLPPVNARWLFSRKTEASEAGRLGKSLYAQIQECVFLQEVVGEQGDPCYARKPKWHDLCDP
eukprot:1823563-Rhodomonas_salina.1